ncbi:MAG TPA: hypothetical protein VGQ96_02730, partial [Candidatus Eremiobacteraceae bacterium]|nr:hypothetical protein [Candidatus Eremiobacteraceae bacterium]
WLTCLAPSEASTTVKHKPLVTEAGKGKIPVIDPSNVGQVSRKVLNGVRSCNGFCLFLRFELRLLHAALISIKYFPKSFLSLFIVSIADFNIVKVAFDGAWVPLKYRRVQSNVNAQAEGGPARDSKDWQGKPYIRSCYVDRKRKCWR